MNSNQSDSDAPQMKWARGNENFTYFQGDNDANCD